MWVALSSYLSEGAGCLQTHAQEKKKQFEDVQNALDLVGFETEVREGGREGERGGGREGSEEIFLHAVSGSDLHLSLCCLAHGEHQVWSGRQ